MNRGIRWVPAKSARLGQAVTGNPEAAVAVVAPPVEAQPAAKGILEKMIYGGLMVAGAALVLTLAVGSND